VVTFLADTNVLSEMRKRDRMAAGVQTWIEAFGWSALSTSWIVIGEMRYGANLIARRDKG
jgi:predicted nucleic acid-binding protein